MKAIHIVWFFQLTCFGWLIFRAQNVHTITTFTESIFLDMRIDSVAVNTLMAFLFYVTPLILMQCIQVWKDKLYVMGEFHWFLRLHIWVFLIMSLLALRTSEEVEFIYFAF